MQTSICPLPAPTTFKRMNNNSDKNRQTRTKVELDMSSQVHIGWLVVLRIYVALAVFQPYRKLEAGNN